MADGQTGLSASYRRSMFEESGRANKPDYCGSRLVHAGKIQAEGAAISTAEVIFERTKELPDGLQSEVLRFVEFLLARYEPEAEDKEWASFSADQLLAAYGPADAAYDEE